MPTELGDRFGRSVLSNFTRLQERSLGKSYLNESLLASAAEIRTGHPLFSDLEIGEQRSSDLASVFLDLSNFTGRTFWDDPEDVAFLAHAVLSGFTEVVKNLGGHVLGLRGDGLFAAFGPTSDPAVAVGVAATACAAALEGVKEVLNPQLRYRNIDPVVARAGADYGTAVFVRSGIASTSEVNVIGFASNFAAKCEKSANAWELVVGETFASHINVKSHLFTHAESPKKYTREYQTKSYNFYNYSWKHLLPEVDSTVAELGGNSLEMINF